MYEVPESRIPPLFWSHRAFLSRSRMVKSPFLHTPPTNGLLTWLCCGKNDTLSKTNGKAYLSKSKVVPLCNFRYSDSLAIPHVALLSRIRLRNRAHPFLAVVFLSRVLLKDPSSSDFVSSRNPPKFWGILSLSQLVTPIQTISMANLIMQLWCQFCKDIFLTNGKEYIVLWTPENLAHQWGKD